MDDFSFPRPFWIFEPLFMNGDRFSVVGSKVLNLKTSKVVGYSASSHPSPVSKLPPPESPHIECGYHDMTDAETVANRQGNGRDAG